MRLIKPVAAILFSASIGSLFINKIRNPIPDLIAVGEMFPITYNVLTRDFPDIHRVLIEFFRFPDKSQAPVTVDVRVFFVLTILKLLDLMIQFFL